MSSLRCTVKDVYSAMVVTLAWSLAANQAQAEAWVPVEYAGLDAVFVEQNALLDGYHAIVMDPLSVWFSESDTMDGERVATLEAFRSAYASAFTENWSRQGFELVDEAAPGVLRVHVEIVDLMVNEFSEQQLIWAERFSFPTAPQHLTLVAEVSDASTGKVLMRIADLGLPGDGAEVWSVVRESFAGWAASLAGVVAAHGQGPSLAAR